MEIRTLKDLNRLKNLKDLDMVIIHTKRLKYKGLLHYALKYSYWSLKEEGELIIIDNGPFDIGIKPYKINIYQINQIVFQFLKDCVELVERDFSTGFIKLKVIDKAARHNTKWSCGIIYSGNSSEQKQLLMCLDGILNQKQFHENESEVLICGPNNADYSFLNNLPKNVRVIFSDKYLKNNRFLISSKKNFLISNFKNENCLLLHTRIVLDNNTLGNVPECFDYLSPFVYTVNRFETKRYLDFLNNGSYDATRVLKELYIPRNYDPKKYLNYVKYGMPYVDGGIMLFKKHILQKCPLNENLGWFENEDVDLSSRLHLNGFLIDYAYQVKAHSLTNKVKSSGNINSIGNFMFIKRILVIRYLIKSLLSNTVALITFNYFKLR